MKRKIYTFLITSALAAFGQMLFTNLIFVSRVAAQTPRRDTSALIANIPVGATLGTGQKSLPVKGRMSLNLEISPDGLKAGTVDLRGFNLVFFDVDQTALSGKQSAVKQGVLGMTAMPSRTNLRLRYDARTQTVSGEVAVVVHFSQLDELFPQEMVKGGEESDFAVARTQRGKVKFSFKFTDALDKAANESTKAKQPLKAAAQASVDVEVEPLKDNRFAIAGYNIKFAETLLVAEIGLILRFETGSRLCIQPVRIRNNAADPAPTGAGLAFGMPGANTQWSKADVTFQVRDWMTVTDAALKVATEGAEETSIRNSVNVADCIEVFFVENFSPVSLHGGGATWSSGTANAKIISSDGNAVGGIDLTHLAHELGHVLYMGHPGNPFGMFDPSTSTLMCPSGWRRDNPARNSQDNKDHVANPLLTFVLKLRTPGPDCTASADCGACP